MTKLERIGVSLDTALLEKFDKLIKDSTVISSSALFRAKGRHFLLATPC